MPGQHAVCQTIRTEKESAAGHQPGYPGHDHPRGCSSPEANARQPARQRGQIYPGGRRSRLEGGRRRCSPGGALYRVGYRHWYRPSGYGPTVPALCAVGQPPLTRIFGHRTGALLGAADGRTARRQRSCGERGRAGARQPLHHHSPLARNRPAGGRFQARPAR